MSKNFSAIHDNHDFQRAARVTEQWDSIKSRLCVDCKYVQQGALMLECGLFAVRSPVDGVTYYRSCSIAREERGGCEPRGAMWEPKDAQKT